MRVVSVELGKFSEAEAAFFVVVVFLCRVAVVIGYSLNPIVEVCPQLVHLNYTASREQVKPELEFFWLKQFPIPS